MMGRVLSMGLYAFCAMLPLSSAWATASNLVFVTRPGDAPHAQVIDARDVHDCEKSSLPQARCLPVNHFIHSNGKAVSFHALRWLLGTVGLNGTESVLVIGNKADNVRAVAALLYLAGQKQVSILDAPFAPQAGHPGGTGRSFSRETVFTAPMRDIHLVTSDQHSPVSQARLAQFALALGHGENTARLALGTEK